jgi:hypothetical protein
MRLSLWTDPRTILIGMAPITMISAMPGGNRRRDYDSVDADPPTQRQMVDAGRYNVR